MATRKEAALNSHNVSGFLGFGLESPTPWPFGQLPAAVDFVAPAGVQSLLGAAFATASSSSAPEAWLLGLWTFVQYTCMTGINDNLYIYIYIIYWIYMGVS